jgi:hypothetical protein
MSKAPTPTQSSFKSLSSAPSSFWPFLFFILLALNVVAFSWNPLKGGDDFWGHAAIGQWALENQSVPRRSLFLWTADIPWVYHAYGSGVVFAALLNLGGPVLALLFNAFASLLPFALVWFWWRKNRPFASVFALFLVVAIWVSCARWHLRPEIFTANFLVFLFLFFMGSQRPLWLCGLVVAMFALWPNMHGGSLMGIAVVWGTAIAELIDDRKNGLKTLALAVISTLAVFAGSAYHFGYVDAWKSFGTELFLLVDEWKPFWWKPYMPPEVIIGVFLLWGSALWLWFKSPERKLSHLAWLLLFMLAFVRARRQLWLVSIASLTVMAIYATPLCGQSLFGWYHRIVKRASSFDGKVPAGFTNIARYGTLAILCCSLIAALTREKQPSAVYDSKFPHGMAKFLETKAPAGRMFNDYEYSASLQWLLYGKREFYIDLINAYPQELLKEYSEVLKASAKGRKVLDERNIDIVALRPRKKGESMNELVTYLNSSPQWQLQYDGVDGTVWVRSVALTKRSLVSNSHPVKSSNNSS